MKKLMLVCAVMVFTIAASAQSHEGSAMTGTTHPATQAVAGAATKGAPHHKNGQGMKKVHHHAKAIKGHAGH